jgi:hypothetical protein
MPIIPWRTDADGYRFVNTWTLDTTERAALAAIANPIAAAAGPMLIPIFPPLALDPVTMTAISTAAVAAVNIVAGTAPISYGMCGGMAYSSCDYWHAKLPLPTGSFRDDQPTRTTPTGTALRNMIWSRLLDSLSGGGAFQTTLLWSLILNQVPSVLGGGGGKLNSLTAAEWPKIKAAIDAGNPCPIGLLYATRDVWDQHQVLVYGYDDFGTHGNLYVYDNNNPHVWGNAGHTSGDDMITFDFTGPALKATSPGDALGGTLAGFFVTNYTPKAPPANLAATYGQFLSWTNDTRFWEFAYGGLLPIANNTELAALGGTVAGVCATLTTVPVNLVRPRDNALLRERSAAPVFLYEGGCPFHVPDPATLNLFGGFAATRLAPDNTISKFVGPPDNGTLLRERSSAHVFQINGGVPMLSTTPLTNASVRVLFDGALNSLLLGNITFSASPVLLGSSLTGTVHLKTAFPDRDLVITLASAQPNYVTVPASVTIPKNNASATFPITTHAIAVTNALTVPITATLGETSTSASLAVQLPGIAAFTVLPNPVTSGQTATASIRLTSAYPAAITIALKSYGTAFATVPASVTIPANATTVNFTVTAVPITTPFAPAKVDLNASYSGVSADCTLIVNPSVIAGTVKALTFSPNPVSSGGTTHGTVTLMGAVTTSTNVGLMSGILGHPSAIIATMPDHVTINAGSTQGTFSITVKSLTGGTTPQTAKITAIAVDQAFATLTVS